jgi:hypothetical protein
MVMAMLEFLRRKKKEQKESDNTVLGVGYSADADKVLKQVKGEQKPAPAKMPEKRDIPDVPVEQFYDIAKQVTDADKEKKRKRAMTALSRAK